MGCWAAAFAAIATYIAWFNSLGYFKLVLSWWDIMAISAVSSIAATLCETLPGPDNLTVPAAAGLASWYWCM